MPIINVSITNEITVHFYCFPIKITLYNTEELSHVRQPQNRPWRYCLQQFRIQKVYNLNLYPQTGLPSQQLFKFFSVSPGSCWDSRWNRSRITLLQVFIGVSFEITLPINVRFCNLCSCYNVVKQKY